MSKLKNMTDGKPIRLMIQFALPLVLTNALQMLFTVADSAVVGRILGVNAFAAVLATANLHWFVLSFSFGMSQGFGTYFAQRFGADDFDGLRRAFVTAAYIALGFGVVVGGIGIAASRPVLVLLETPQELLYDSIVYLAIILGGLPIMFIYNMLSMSLYSLGDSRTPLKASIIAMALNIALNLLLIFPFGIAGVAVASLVAQSVASIYCFITLKKTGILDGCGLKPHRDAVRPLLKFALPLGFRNAVIEVGGLLVQRYINISGTEYVAGIGAARRMYSLLMIAGGAIEASTMTFVAQNFGAGRFDRVKSGVKDGLRLALFSALIIMALVLPFGRGIMGLMVSGDPYQINAVLDIGEQQLRIMAVFLPFLHLLFLFRAALQGIGNTIIPMISGFVEAGTKIFSAIVITQMFGIWGVFLSDPLGWPIATALLVIAYAVSFKGINKLKEERI